MDDRNEQIYSQYEIDIDNIYKKRGFVYLESREDLFVIKPYNYTEKKAVIENLVKDRLINKGFDMVDVLVKNKDNTYLTYNKYGNRFVLKKWFKGEECDITSIKDIEKASINLARLHCVSNNIVVESEEGKLPKKNIIQEYEGYNKELKSVRKYIYKKKKKNILELNILKYIDTYYKEADYFYNKLRECEYERLYNESIYNGNICHGNYTHHSLLINNEMIATINFDKVAYGVLVYDLYCFLRKTMEKNDWNIELGRHIIDKYNTERALSQTEKEVLYIFIAYPDKFRKLVNSYYNGKKALVSIRISEKLEELINTEVKKKEFLVAMKKIYGINI